MSGYSINFLSTIKFIVRHRYFKYLIYLICVTFLQIIIAPLISIDSVAPDFFIIFVVWLAIKEPPTFALIVVFFIGILSDIIFLDVLGTNALCKTIAAYSATLFYKEGEYSQTIKKYKFPLLVLLAAFLHNVVISVIYSDEGNLDYLFHYLKYTTLSTLYTTFFALFIFIYHSIYKRRIS